MEARQNGSMEKVVPPQEVHALLNTEEKKTPEKRDSVADVEHGHGIGPDHSTK